MARRRHVAILGASAKARHTDRSRRLELALARSIVSRAGPCRDLPDRGGRAVQGTTGVDRGTAAAGVQSRAADVVQDRARSHCRRQYLHVAARRRDDFADHLARSGLHALAARRRAPQGAGDRLRDRQQQEHTGARRIAALDPHPGVGAVEAFRVPARLSHASWPLGGAHRRDAGQVGARHAAHHHRGDAAAGPDPLRHRADGGRRCAGLSTSTSRQMAISTTYTDRPTTSTI